MKRLAKVCMKVALVKMEEAKLGKAITRGPNQTSTRRIYSYIVCVSTN